MTVSEEPAGEEPILREFVSVTANADSPSAEPAGGNVSTANAGHSVPVGSGPAVAPAESPAVAAIMRSPARPRTEQPATSGTAPASGAPVARTSARQVGQAQQSPQAAAALRADRVAAPSTPLRTTSAGTATYAVVRTVERGNTSTVDLPGLAPFPEAVQATTIRADTSTERAAYETAVTGLPVATPIARSVEIARSSSALSDVEPSGVRGSPQPAQPSMEPGTYAGRLVDTFDAPVRTRAMAAGADIHTPPSEMPVAAGPAQLPAQSPEPGSLTMRRMPIAVGARPGTATLGAVSSLSGAMAIANASSSARPIVRTPELQRVPAREVAERPSSVVSRSALVDVPHAPVARAFTPEGGRAGTSQAGLVNSPLSQVARLGTFGGTPGGRSPVFAGGGPGSRFEALPWAATSAAPVDTGTADAPVARMTARSTATESRQEAAQPETPAQAGPSQMQTSGSMAPASAGTPGVAADGAAEQDVDKLADKVWAIIRQKLHIERERQRGF